MASKPVLVYFPVTGKAEIARLSFLLGKVDFEDKQIPFAEWAALKPTTPFGQVPLLQLGDITVAQSAGIDHYAAKLGGLIPEDPVQALLVDQYYYFVTQDIHAGLIGPTGKLSGEEQVKARQELAGPIKDKLAQLEKIVASKKGRFLVGDSLTLADLAIFNFIGILKSGFWKGIPTDVASGFPALKALWNDIASWPEIKAHYAAATDDIRKNYRPDEA